MPGTLTRPNANPILAVMRDDDFSDPWGTGMSWAGAVCDVLYDADPNAVPASLGYSPGVGGPEVPNGGEGVHRITVTDVPWETAHVWCWLHGLDETAPESHPDPEDLPYWSDPAFRARAAELVTAAVCLSRYLDWVKAAGRDY